jgi:hypothetical protein
MVMYDVYTEAILGKLNDFLSPLISDITPSRYHYLFPTRLSMPELDAAASKGFFPNLMSLVPALWICFLFGVARFLLTFTVFKVRITH